MRRKSSGGKRGEVEVSSVRARLEVVGERDGCSGEAERGRTEEREGCDMVRLVRSEEVDG